MNFLKSEREMDRNLSGFITNILICVLKMNSLIGLEWHEGKIMKIFIFGWTIPLNSYSTQLFNFFLLFFYFVQYFISFNFKTPNLL